MSIFRIIDNQSQIPIGKDWIDLNNTSSEELVDNHGQKPAVNYQGHKYKIISEKEHHFPLLERIGKSILGGLASAVTLSAAYFLFPRIKQLFNGKETVRFGILVSNSSQPVTPSHEEIKTLPPINLNSKNPFDDLTQVNFGSEKHTLTFRFVKAREERLCKIVNSMTPSVYYKKNFPDTIRFSTESTLIAKIKELTPNIYLYKLPMSYDKESGYYVIPAKDSRIFFEAIRQLQTSGSEMCIPKKSFQKTLHSLQKKHHITPSEAELLSIKTSLTLEEYKNEVKQTQDVQKAISLAYYYRDTTSSYYEESALHWLCKAKQYAGTRNLSEFFNIDEFLQNLKKINYQFVFRADFEEIVAAIARNTSIKELGFCPFTDYDAEITKGIGTLLEKTTSIEKVSLHSAWCFDGNRLNSNTITPIANALRTNTSIQSLDLNDTRISDEGVSKVVQAISANPNSKITSLNLACCGMTDKSAVEVLQLLRTNKQITWIHMLDNKGISKTIQEDINHILEERNRKST